VDFIVSGIFAAHFVNTVSPSFLQEIVDGRHSFVAPELRQELSNKAHSGCGVGILNAPDPSFNPTIDTDLVQNFTPDAHPDAKRNNKIHLQNTLGLTVNPDSPLFFWPHRLDPVQKGCQLLAEILYSVVSRYWDQELQIVFVANGDYQRVFRDITEFHGLHRRVAVCDFDERLARLAYGAADFMLMPSRFEPCGLPQMIAPIYGALPVAHDTGGIHDTVTQIDTENGTGNGFLFVHYDSQGLMWAIDQAMAFFGLPGDIRAREIRRIMVESADRFTHSVTAREYMVLYERMLDRPLITPSSPSPTSRSDADDGH
ncbi:MAG: glycosyltransferase, partial [Desulfobacterales bacterium]|jgi:starch synthase/alpha-amylase